MWAIMGRVQIVVGALVSDAATSGTKMCLDAAGEHRTRLQVSLRKPTGCVTEDTGFPGLYY